MNQSERLKWAQSELQRSKRWRNQESYDEDWRRFIDLYRGKQYEGDNSASDRLIVNIVFATKNVLGPAVAINNPKFVVSARKPDVQAQAMLTTEILNYLWRTNRYQADFRLAVDDFITIGHGWIKTGYKFVKEPVSKKADVDGENADTEVEGVDDREDKEGNTESEMTVLDDRPFVERISPFDIFVDPDARHPKEMRWIAQRTWRPVADVHVDSRYSATNRKKVGGKSYSRISNGQDRDARDDNNRGQGPAYAEIIEFYDIKRNKVGTFAMDAPGDDGVDGANGWLIKCEDIPFAMGHPFTMLRNYEVPDFFYPIGDIEQIASLQFELNETRNQMLNHRKRFARKWVYNRDAFDKDGINALESEIDNTMVPVISDENPGNVIAPVPAVVTPPEFYDQSSMISTDMDRVSGVSDYQRGAQTAIKRTATEAAMIQDAANSRAQDRLAKIEDVLAQVGEKIIGLMQQYLTGEHVARIISLPGASWLEYDKDYIQGQFDFTVVGGSTEPQNETFKRQSAMQLVDASMPFLESGVADPVTLYRKVLDGFGVKDASEFISDQAREGQAPQPPGQEQEAQGPVPPAPGPPSPAGPGMPPGGGPPAAPPQGVPPIPPEILELLPPEIQQGIMSGQIPPEMVQQMLMEIQAEQGGMEPPMAPAGPPMM